MCRRGYVDNAGGRCIEKRAECDAGPNEYRDDDGNCVCKRGYVRDDHGRCVEKRAQCDPGPNEYRDDDGRCVCKNGSCAMSNGLRHKAKPGLRAGPE